MLLYKVQEGIKVDKKDLDALWSIGYVEKIREDGNIISYAYRFDSTDDENNGIVEFEKDILDDISQETKFNDVIKMFIDERIKIIKKCKHKKLCLDGLDLGTFVALKLIVENYMSDEGMPNVKEVLNMKAVERMKYTNPEGYEEMMKAIEEEGKRQTS